MNDKIEKNVENDGNAVEEMPCPPMYFRNSDNLLPPILDENLHTTSWSAGFQYNGVMGSLLINQEIVVVLNENYKNEMKRFVSMFSF